jgi:hypothetical protein
MQDQYLNLIGLSLGLASGLLFVYGSLRMPWGSMQTWSGESDKEKAYNKRQGRIIRTASFLLVLSFLVQAIALFPLEPFRKNGSQNPRMLVPPTPSPIFHPTPAPVPAPVSPRAAPPALTAEDYKQPFATFTARGISVQYPSSWILHRYDDDDEGGDMAMLTRPALKNYLESLDYYEGYGYDLSISHRTKLDRQELFLGENIKVAGKNAYRADVVGLGSIQGVVIEHDGFFILTFGESRDRKLQDEILKHVKFTN